MVVLVGTWRLIGGTWCWEEPVAIPAPQEYFDLGGETEVLYVAGETLPLDETLVEGGFNVIGVVKVHPVEERMDGRRVWDGEEHDGMRG